MKKIKLLNRDEVQIIARKYNFNLGKFDITDSGLIDVHGDVDIKYSSLEYLPLRFGKINGSFNCGGLALQSLKGSPAHVRYNFNCDNNLLSTLKHGPKYVGGTYDCSRNKLQNLHGCAPEIGRELICKMNTLKTLYGCPKAFFGSINCSHNQLTDFTGVPERFKGDLHAHSNYLKNLIGFKEFDGTIFVDCTASSINTGYFDTEKMKIEVRQHSKYGHKFMPLPIQNNLEHLALVIQYQRYFEIWTDKDELNLDNFLILIDEIKDGLL
jgi:hypothetical protein